MAGAKSAYDYTAVVLIKEPFAERNPPLSQTGKETASISLSTPEAVVNLGVDPSLVKTKALESA